MRVIQTEIRHDRIENDNRKNELQSKAQGGLKTANKAENIEEPVQNNAFNQPQAVNTPVQTAEKLPQMVSELPQTANEPAQATVEPQQASSVPPQIAAYAEKQGAEELKSDTVLYGDERQANDVIITTPHNETAASKNTVYTQIKADSNKPQLTHQLTAAEMGIQSRVKHDSLENTVKRNVIQNKSEIGIKTAKTNINRIEKIKGNAKSGFANKGIVKAKVAGTLKAAATVGSSAAGVASGSVPSGDNDDLTSESANNVKKTAATVTEKSLEAVKNFAGNKARTVKTSSKGKKGHSRIYNFRVNLSNRITEHIKPLKFVRDKAMAIKKSTVRAVNSLKVVKAIKKLNSIKVEDLIKASKPVKAIQSLKVVKAVKKLNSIKVEDILKSTKAFKAFNSLKAVKAVKKLNSIKIGGSAKTAIKGAEKVKGAVGKMGGAAIKGVSSTVNTVQRFKGLAESGDIGSDLAEQAKDMAGKAAEKTAHLSKKAVNKISKSVKTMNKAAKPAKRTIRTASKKAVKTSAKASAQAAKSAAKAAQKTAEASAKLSAKIISGIANAVGSLMSSPAGPIVLIIVLIVVLIVVIFNIISGAVQVPATVVSGAGSSLGWLFGDDSRANDDIADIYADFEDAAKLAMEDAKNRYKNEISGIGFGERDSVVFNGASFYPASAADGFIQSFFDSLDYDDYVYLCEICYIKKLRDERAAQGLTENDMPEVTITQADIYSFLLDYCYNFNITIEHGQTCPTMDCQEEESTYYHGESCPDVEDGGTCPGHTYIHYYCDHSHIRAIITIQQVPRDVLENDVLVLTEYEKNLLDIGLELLNDSLQP